MTCILDVGKDLVLAVRPSWAMGAMVAVVLVFIPLASNNKVADQIPNDILNSQSRKAMSTNPSPVK